jgi:hypothetical protein
MARAVGVAEPEELVQQRHSVAASAGYLDLQAPEESEAASTLRE